MLPMLTVRHLNSYESLGWMIELVLKNSNSSKRETVLFAKILTNVCARMDNILNISMPKLVLNPFYRIKMYGSVCNHIINGI